jgi:hypothetical protein
MATSKKEKEFSKPGVEDLVTEMASGFFIAREVCAL